MRIFPVLILIILKEASEKEIKKQYRELSKTMHPDKGGDEEKFKQLAKAYQALTDEETRKNWQEYGNPDGPGGKLNFNLLQYKKKRKLVFNIISI